MNYRTTREISKATAWSALARGGFSFMLGLLVLGSNAPFAYAGFGITPPYVQNDRLTRGTTFEQHITLVRSDPVDDLKVQITMNLPGVESWFSVDKGNEFVMPAGVSQMPIVVTVHVPPDAAYESHTGAIRIRTSSASAASSGAVSIALGAQVDVAITVVDKIFDFDVRRIRVTDLEEGYRKWSLFFPGKIRFFMTIENTGNTEFGPTKVRMDIYDSDSAQLLETTENTNNIEEVTPFGTKEVIAELPTRLPAGSYIAKYTIFKNADIAQQDQVSLSISPLGGVPGYTGYGFDGLSMTDKLKVGLVALVPLVFLIFLIVALVARRRRRAQRAYGGVR
jgi:hypothetical protein